MKHFLSILLLTLLTAGVALSAPAKRTSAQAKKEKTALKSDVRKTQKQIAKLDKENMAYVKEVKKLSVQIDEHKENIRLANLEVGNIENRIISIRDSMEILEEKVKTLRASYADVVRHVSINRKGAMSLIAFVFSADSFKKAYRRMRYLREFSTWRARKAEELTAAVNQLNDKRQELTGLKKQQYNTIVTLKAEQLASEKKQTQTSQLLASNRALAKSLKDDLEKKRAAEAVLDAEIRRLAAQEKVEEKARKKELERQKRELERQKALERQRERERQKELERQKAIDASKTASTKPETAKRADESKSAGIKTGKPASATAGGGKNVASTDERLSSPVEQVRKEMPSVALKEPLTLAFEAKKGNHLFPVTGSYKILCHFNQPRMSSVKNSSLGRCKGIEINVIDGKPRAIFKGSVSSAFRNRMDGLLYVIIRVGDYMVAYTGLETVTVSHGKNVEAGQILGTVHQDEATGNRIMTFMIVKVGEGNRNTNLNPEEWVR